MLYEIIGKNWKIGVDSGKPFRYNKTNEWLGNQKGEI